MVPGTDAVMIDVKAEDNNLQVIPNDHVISPFDIIFEGEFGNNLYWNVTNVFDVVLPGQAIRTIISPNGDMFKCFVPEITMDRLLYVVDFLTLVKARWSLKWGVIGSMG